MEFERCSHFFSSVYMCCAEPHPPLLLAHVLPAVTIVGGAPVVSAQNNWTEVGVTAAQSIWGTIGLDFCNGSAHIVFVNTTVGAPDNETHGYYYIRIMSYLDSAGWVEVGNPLTDAYSETDMDLACNGATPMVAFQDYIYNDIYQYVRVKTFANGYWSDLGDTAACSVDSVSLAVENGVPYIAFVNVSDGYFGAARVMIFDGEWKDFGDPATPAFADVSLAFNLGSPTIAFADNYLNVRVMVNTDGSRFSGGTWSEVGATGAYSNTIVSLAFNNGPFIAFACKDTQVPRVMTYAGGVWSDVGTINQISSSVVSLAFDGTVPVVAFTSNETLLTHVMSYSGSSWTDVVTPMQLDLGGGFAINNGSVYVTALANAVPSPLSGDVQVFTSGKLLQNWEVQKLTRDAVTPQNPVPIPFLQSFKSDGHRILNSDFFLSTQDLLTFQPWDRSLLPAPICTYYGIIINGDCH